LKITSRIIAGYGLLIGILAGMAVYQAVTIARMQSINNTLRETNFLNARTCLEAMQDQERIEEFVRKTYLLGDLDYLNQAEEYREDYENKVLTLKRNAGSKDEQAAVAHLEQIWNSFAADFRQLHLNPPQKATPLPESLEGNLETLRSLTRSVYEISMRTMSEQVRQSRETSRTAELILWCSVFTALAISILVSFLIYRSISNPLAHLTEGTRAIAEGKFYYRLDTSRNDEFSQLARDFNTMTRRLSELDELKKDFVSHVSHELKAPLASMRETIQLMLDQVPGPLTDKQKRLLELNLQSEYRLTSMVRNLLDLSRIEAGVMEYEMRGQDLVPLVRNAIAEIEVQAGEKQIQLLTAFPEGPVMVECDASRIVQVIVNLAGNAVKFSPKRGTVHVHVEAARSLPPGVPRRWRPLPGAVAKDGCFGLVTVSDLGPGIPDSEKEKVFDRFHQVKRDKKIAGQGVGLGLAISRTIVEAHRGAIWVEDNPGGGCRFFLLLRPGEVRDDERTYTAV